MSLRINAEAPNFTANSTQGSDRDDTDSVILRGDCFRTVLGHYAPTVWHTMRAGAFRCCVVHFVATELKPCDRPMPARVDRVFRRSVRRWRPIPL